MDPYRLPRDVTPRHYRLVLEPDLDELAFSGVVAIELDVREPTDRIVLNAIELDIDWAVVTSGATAIPNATIDLDDETERLTIGLPAPLEKGPALLELSFRGVLNDQLHGFYRSTFSTDDGATPTIATTQFQSTDARRAFPCWDEPDLKATFGITLVVRDGDLAIANTREVGREVTPDGRVAVNFADTIPMSTYLVAFVVGPMDVTDPRDVDGVEVRIVHRPGQDHLTGFALDVAEAALRYYVDYYDLPYPGDKLDMVAIPDFAFGAMENLGCVTYREVLLLVDPETAAQAELQRVADVINHELAHMWFGDLVTMRWWNGIWLNEAFATFMETKATDAFRPEWDRWTDFGLSRSMAFDVDSLASTRPIEFPVHSPADAEGMFDVLTYEKGAAVVRMLEQHLGEDTFREGVRLYLRRHQLSNTDTDDLWAALAEASGEPVSAVMHDWIFQGGYPLIEYERHPDGLHLDQRRFGFGAVDETRWHIPVAAATGDETQRVLLTDGATIDHLAELPRLNVDGSGFYRVHLDDIAVGAVADGLALSLPPVERYGIVDDSWALVLADRLPLDSYLRMVVGFEADDELAVWQRIASSLSALHHVCPDTTLPLLSSYIGERFTPLAERWGRQASPGESDRQRQLRALALTMLGIRTANTSIMAWARTTHTEGTDDPELATAAVSVLASGGDPADFDRFWQAYHEAPTPQEERRYLDALADFDDPSLLTTLCERSLGEEIRTQDAPYLLGRALTNRRHGPMVWKYVAAHWTAVNDQFPSNSIARMLGGIRALSHAGVAEDVHRFLDDHPVPQGDLMIRQHRERLSVNVALRARAEADLVDALG